jgi:CheY-like chemotaxis protein/GGDEF domain-containing protein
MAGEMAVIVAYLSLVAWLRSQETCAAFARRLGRMRVLIIDDDPQLVRLAGFALRARGMVVLAATTPAEGLRLAATESVDVVLLDVVMPEMDGAAVLAALRSGEATRELPVVFFSAKATEELLALGAVGVIRKPFHPARLAGQLLSILGRTDMGNRPAEVPAELRRGFLLSAVERMDAIEQAVDRMRRQDDVESLRIAASQFHALAGGAASFGLLDVSQAARHAEHEADDCLAAARPLLLQTLLGWRDLLQEMRRSLAAAGLEGMPPARRTIRLLCVAGDPATQASLRLLDADSGFKLDVMVDGVPDILVAAADDAGFELLERLRQVPHGRRMAVLMLATHQPDLERAIRLGVDGLLTDGANAAAVLGKVRWLADRNFGPPPRVLFLGLDRHAQPFGSVLESAGYLVRIGIEADVETFEPDVIVAGDTEPVRTVHLHADPLAVPIVLILDRDAPFEPALHAGVTEVLRLPIARRLLIAAIQNRVEAARAYKMATRLDPLTGCLRDEYFRERLQRRMTRSAPDAPLTLVMAETESLLPVADLLRRRLRETDEIARCGANRLAVAMERIDTATAAALFQHLQEELAFQVAIAPQPEHHSAERWIRAAGEMLTAPRRSSDAGSSATRPSPAFHSAQSRA